MVALTRGAPVLRVLAWAYGLAALVALLWLRHQPAFGRETILWMLVCILATDIGAYFVGAPPAGQSSRRASAPARPGRD